MGTKLFFPSLARRGGSVKRSRGGRCSASQVELWRQTMSFRTKRGIHAASQIEFGTQVDPSQVQLGTERSPLTDHKLPENFFLEQNYPNPFNPTTTIQYELPRSLFVRLSVYDALGREVAILVNEKKEMGVHKVRFDGEALSSGVFFYRLQAGDFSRTGKMLMLR
jgi:hypothetical protein